MTVRGNLGRYKMPTNWQAIAIMIFVVGVIALVMVVVARPRGRVS